MVYYVSTSLNQFSVSITTFLFYSLKILENLYFFQLILKEVLKSFRDIQIDYFDIIKVFLLKYLAIWSVIHLLRNCALSYSFLTLCYAETMPLFVTILDFLELLCLSDRIVCCDCHVSLRRCIDGRVLSKT